MKKERAHTHIHTHTHTYTRTYGKGGSAHLEVKRHRWEKERAHTGKGEQVRHYRKGDKPHWKGDTEKE